jgi:hypothetical protein
MAAFNHNLIRTHTNDLKIYAAMLSNHAVMLGQAGKHHEAMQKYQECFQVLREIARFSSLLFSTAQRPLLANKTGPSRTRGSRQRQRSSAGIRSISHMAVLSPHKLKRIAKLMTSTEMFEMVTRSLLYSLRAYQCQEEKKPLE